MAVSYRFFSGSYFLRRGGDRDYRIAIASQQPDTVDLSQPSPPAIDPDIQDFGTQPQKPGFFTKILRC
ncbi:hypothetical protein PN499_03945 [Kamptonema animale CS-326]|uniref:hypothetical protein n=1 Tax=Kamptonema animale TaxID=92934 RepID=UPI00232EAF32|nr:hypothetical protein [Kamptonema animale]MDB9510354.1 hypothetical protein [Kamptonema animale CS-326]